MNPRFANTLDVDINNLNEEELEAYLAQLDKDSEETASQMNELDTKRGSLVKQKNEHEQIIAKLDGDIAAIRNEKSRLSLETQQRINEALPYTGKVTRIDFTKASQSLDPNNELPQKALTPAKYSPPSSAKTSTPPSSGSDLSRASSPSISGNSSGSDSDEKERSKSSLQTKAPAATAKQPVASRSTAAITSTLSKDTSANKPTPAPALPKVTPSTVKVVEEKSASTAAKTAIPKNTGFLARFGLKKEESQPAKIPTVAATQAKTGMSSAR